MSEVSVFNCCHAITLQDGRISYQEFAAMMRTGMDWKMASRRYSRVMLNALSMKIFRDKTMHRKACKTMKR